MSNDPEVHDAIVRRIPILLEGMEFMPFKNHEAWWIKCLTLDAIQRDEDAGNIPAGAREIAYRALSVEYQENQDGYGTIVVTWMRPEHIKFTFGPAAASEVPPEGAA